VLVRLHGARAYKCEKGGKRSLMGTDSTKEKIEGALEKAIGHVKEAAGSLPGNKILLGKEGLAVDGHGSPPMRGPRAL
jgi:hypothetical protein